MLKKLFLIIILFPSLVIAQNNKADSSRKPYITPIGKPFGNVTTAKMDNKGGIIKSDDGKFEIIFPADALDAETTVSIQATHNELNENDEGAYQLEPSGLQFKKPVQLVFHYSGSNENADLKSIAWQDDKGQWRELKKVITDTTQKTVTGFVPHFSRWTRFDQLYLRPVSASVKVNKTIRLEVVNYNYHPTPSANSASGSNQSLLSDDDDILFAPAPSFYLAEPTANGIVNGNSEVGTVTKQDIIYALYKAPAVVPDNNPVAVSVQIYSDKQTRKLLLTSNITVIGDQYHFTYIHIDEGDGCYFMVDSSSCIINMERSKASISNIINYRPWSDWPNCDKCRWEWTNKETVKGLVEINGMISSVITPPGNEGGVTNVYITLTPAMGSTPSAIAHCKGGDRTIPSMPVPADPKYINFDIDGDNLILHFGAKTGTNELVIEGHNEKTMIYIYKLN